jgi:UDP-3-O-[3-hydroxymyristoyl] glucosamine N-acyltransferase
MIHSYSLEFILDLIDSDFTTLGDYKGSISGVATLAEAEEGELYFFNNPKYKEAFT